MPENSCLNLEKCHEISHLIEKLCHTGCENLDVEEVKKLLSICQFQQGYVEHTFARISTTFEEKHSEVRLSCLQLYNEFFQKYEIFRTLVLRNFDKFCKLTLGIKSENTLPPPLKASKSLKRQAISFIHKWYVQFGHENSRLKTAYEYLKNVENVDFSTLEILDRKERERREAEERRLKKINKERLLRINIEMEELNVEVQNTITALETCFVMLLPDPEQFDIDCQIKTEPSGSSDFREVGVLKHNQEVNIEVELGNKISIDENEENSSILENIKGCYSLINNKFLPKTKAWVEIIVKAEGGSELLKKALSQKNILQTLVDKYNKLEIRKNDKKEEVSTDSEMEEVEEPIVTKKNREEEFSLLAHGNNDSLKSKEIQHKCTNDLRPSTSFGNPRKEKLMEIAPKLPYDIDLYHWEDEKLPTPTMLPVNCEGHRFWSATSNEDGMEIQVPDGSASLRTRVIEFTGEFTPVTRACSAPLPSGKLCPRYDRIKCPFHGLIVPRDGMGRIINPEDEEKVKNTQPKQNVPDWQDPQLLEEIKASTGVDLKMPEKGKKKKKKFPGLTDIKALADTPTRRLSKKVFSKSSVKRVAATLDKLDHKRFRDKFGDQFNYVHDTT